MSTLRSGGGASSCVEELVGTVSSVEEGSRRARLWTVCKVWSALACHCTTNQCTSFKKIAVITNVNAENAADAAHGKKYGYLRQNGCVNTSGHRSCGRASWPPISGLRRESDPEKEFVLEVCVPHSGASGPRNREHGKAVRDVCLVRNFCYRTHESEQPGITERAPYLPSCSSSRPCCR